MGFQNRMGEGFRVGGRMLAGDVFLHHRKEVYLGETDATWNSTGAPTELRRTGFAIIRSKDRLKVGGGVPTFICWRCGNLQNRA